MIGSLGHIRAFYVFTHVTPQFASGRWVDAEKWCAPARTQYHADMRPTPTTRLWNLATY